jgi:hypothetical protein
VELRSGRRSLGAAIPSPRVRSPRARRDSSERPPTPLPCIALAPHRARRGDRQANRRIRPGRRDRSHRGDGLARGQAARHQHVPARRLPWSCDCRQQHPRRCDVSGRSAWRRAGLRRRHGRVALVVLHRSTPGSVRLRDMGERLGRLSRPHQCLVSDGGGHRSRTDIPAGKHAEQRLVRCAPLGRQPLRRVHRLP